MATKKEQFLSICPSDNVDWAAQQILMNFTKKQFMELEACFTKLNEALYKGWAKDMTFNELTDAVKLANENL